MNEVLLALAQAAPQKGPQQDLWSTMSMMAIIFVIFYFLLIRPQQKQLKEHKKMQSSLQRDDRVVTSSGIHGRIVEVGDQTLTVEIADRVKVKIDRSGISKVIKPHAGDGGDGKKK